MSKAGDFFVRSKSEVNKTDEYIADLTLGDLSKKMFSVWQSCAKCHLFVVGSSLFARGKKEDRNFAKGFVAGWRGALRSAIDGEGE